MYYPLRLLLQHRSEIILTLRIRSRISTLHLCVARLFPAVRGRRRRRSSTRSKPKAAATASSSPATCTGESDSVSTARGLARHEHRTGTTCFGAALATGSGALAGDLDRLAVDGDAVGLHEHLADVL